MINTTRSSEPAAAGDWMEIAREGLAHLEEGTNLPEFEQFFDDGPPTEITSEIFQARSDALTVYAFYDEPVEFVVGPVSVAEVRRYSR